MHCRLSFTCWRASVPRPDMDMWPLVLLFVQLCFCSGYEGKQRLTAPHSSPGRLFFFFTLAVLRGKKMKILEQLILRESRGTGCGVSGCSWDCALCAVRWLWVELSLRFLVLPCCCLVNRGCVYVEGSGGSAVCMWGRDRSVALMKGPQLICAVISTAPCLHFLIMYSVLRG